MLGAQQEGMVWAGKAKYWAGKWLPVIWQITFTARRPHPWEGSRLRGCRPAPASEWGASMEGPGRGVPFLSSLCLSVPLRRMGIAIPPPSQACGWLGNVMCIKRMGSNQDWTNAMY